MTRLLLALVLTAAAARAADPAWLRVAKEFLEDFKGRNPGAQALLAGRSAKEVAYTLSVYWLLDRGEIEAAAALAEARSKVGGPEAEGLRRLVATFKRGLRPTRDQEAAIRAAERFVAEGKLSAALDALRGAGAAVEGTVLGPRILWTRARALEMDKRPSQASPLYGRCARQAHAIGWLVRERDAHQARLRVAPRNSSDALEAATGLVEVAKLLDDRPLVLDALRRRGDIHLARGDGKKGRTDYVAAIQLAKQIGRRLRAAQLLGLLSQVFQLQEGQPRQALKHQEESLKILRELAGEGDPEARAWLRLSLFNQATLLKELARYEESLAFLDELFTHKEELGGNLILRGHTQRAYVLRKMGYLETSLAAYGQALAAATTDELRTSLWADIGELHLQRGDLRAARARFQAVLDRDPKHTLALAGRATVRSAQGDEEGALADLSAAAELAAGPGARAKVLLQRAAVERSWGRIGAATKTALEARLLFLEADKDPDQTKRDYGNTAVTYLVLGDLLLLDGLESQAEKALGDGAAFFFGMKNPVRAIPAYERWALVLLKLERFDRALERLQLLKAMAETTPGDDLKSAAASVDAWFEARTGRNAEAVALYEKARTLAADAGSPFREATALAHWALLDPEKGVEKVERALALADGLRVDGPELWPFVPGERPDRAASIGVRALLADKGMAPEEKARKAFRFIAQERDRRLLVALRGRPAILELLPDDLSREHAAARGRLIEARARGEGVEEAEAAFDAMVERLRKNQPGVAGLAFPVTPSLESVQQALEDDEALLLMLDDEYVRALVAVTKTNAHFAEYEQKAPLEGIAALLQGKRKLIVIPDGILALEERPWGGGTVFDAFRVFYLPRVRDLLSLRALGPAEGEGAVRVGGGPKMLPKAGAGQPRAGLLHDGRPVELDLTHPQASTHDPRESRNADAVVLGRTNLARGKRPGTDGVTSVVAALMFGGVRYVILSVAPEAPPADFLERFYKNRLERKMSAPLALREARTWLRKQGGEVWAGLVCYGVP